MTNNQRFLLLTESLKVFISEVRKARKDLQVYEDWNVKEILCHVTFWHVNYAENLLAEENKTTLPLLKGKYSDINIRAFKAYRKKPTETVIKELLDANIEIENVVKRGKVKKMTYKEGSRDYTLDLFFDEFCKSDN